MDERAELIEHILKLDNRIIPHLNNTQPHPWLEVDLTMPQLKTMMLVTYKHGATVGELAKGIGAGLSTMTGIIDRLTEHGLVKRSDDPEDRRVKLVVPTELGYQRMEKLQRFSKEQWRSLLVRLSLEELQTVDKAIEYLHRAALEQMNSRKSF
ncbi:MAG TPA: MarR family transcriptional regulator [Ktedonobacteraceae bacterium]|nr:MarR family transcriptional regulator [Ktedonobacteraceae bacterium]